MDIMRLEIECVWGKHLKEKFLRVVDVPQAMTLGEIHCYIRDDLVRFQDEHFSSFFVAPCFHSERAFFTQDGSLEDDESVWWDIPLTQAFPEDREKSLFYLYDFESAWTFEIRKTETCLPEPTEEALPRLVSEDGPIPTQYVEGEGCGLF